MSHWSSYKSGFTMATSNHKGKSLIHRVVAGYMTVRDIFLSIYTLIAKLARSEDTNPEIGYMNRQGRSFYNPGKRLGFAEKI